MQPQGCFRVLLGDYVTSDTGTGVVHIAPAYGEEDFNLATKNGIIAPNDPCVSVDDNGNFLDIVSDFKGRYVKEADNDIIQHLKKKKRILKVGTIVHSYPFCWRSNTPLIYKAIKTWFIKVSAIKEDLMKNN